MRHDTIGRGCREPELDSWARAAVRRWAEHHRVTVEMPHVPWLRRGTTGAQLAPLVVRHDDDRGPPSYEAILLKVCPAGAAAEEPDRHDTAWTTMPGVARRHLVPQIYPPFPVGDGRRLMFQGLAGELRHCVQVAELTDSLATRIGAEVARYLLTDWNPTHRHHVIACDEYLRLELRHALAEGRSAHHWARAARLLEDEAEWIVMPDNPGVVLPNPVRMAQSRMHLPDLPINALSGRTHGDLHLGNIVVFPPPPDTVRHHGWRLVDLSAFELDAPLSRDIVGLMLSLAARTVRRGVNRRGADALVRLILDPCTAHNRVAGLNKAMRDVYAPGLALASRCDGPPEACRWAWRAQYLLSIQAQAIVYTSYEDIGAPGRWWYLRLAAHAGAAFLALAGHRAPDTGRTVHPPSA